MHKNIYIVLAIVVFIAAIGAYFFYSRPVLTTGPAGTAAPTSTTSAAVGAAAQTSDVVKTGVSGAVGKTNPFQSDVNPVSGYQNPFGN